MKESRLILRRWNIAYLDDLVRYAGNRKIWRNLTDEFPHPYTRADGESFIRRVSAEEPVRVLAIEVEGHAVGAIGITPQGGIHRKNTELGYWLAEPFRGRGIMTLAVREAVGYAFSTFDIDRVYAKIFGSNKASQRVLEKNGFIAEARFSKTVFKDGEYEDEIVYAVRGGEEPRPV